MRIKINNYLIFALLLQLVFSTIITYAAEIPMEQTPVLVNYPENKLTTQNQLIQQILVKYSQDQTFDQIHKYMTLKFQDLKKNRTPKEPEQLIVETFAKSQSVYQKAKPFIGNSFHKLYDPDKFENAVERFFWLKGICFFVLGINDDHKVGVSYFYLPENEGLKKEFLKDVVRFSFPEVQDVPENNVWFQNMMAVMDRLGYKVFDIAKYHISFNSLALSYAP